MTWRKKTKDGGDDEGNNKENDFSSLQITYMSIVNEKKGMRAQLFIFASWLFHF